LFLLYRTFGQAENTTSRVISPKHVPIPCIPQDGNFVFEVIMFVFTGMTSFLQFLHLYRTVWWLPQSYTRYTMVSAWYCTKVKECMWHQMLILLNLIYLN